MAVPQKTIHPRCEELVWNCQCPAGWARMWHLTEQLRHRISHIQESQSHAPPSCQLRLETRRAKIIAIIDKTRWFVSDNFIIVWHSKLVNGNASSLSLIAGCVRSWQEISWADSPRPAQIRTERHCEAWGLLALGSPWVLLPVIPLYLPAGSLSDCSQSSFSTLQYLALVIKLLG